MQKGVISYNLQAFLYNIVMPSTYERKNISQYSVEVNPNPQFDASLTSEYSDPIFFTKFFSSIGRLSSSQNNYLVSKNRAEQKWGYKALEKAILTAYPNIHQDEGVKASYKRTGPLKWVISHLADRRRKQVTRKEGKVFVCETTSVDEAFNLLQTLPSKLWQCTQLKKALFITKDLRCRLQAEETLPDYLLVDSILCYEIGLRLGSNINSLMTAAKTIIRKLHRIDISSIDALIDYLSEGDQRLVSASEIDPFQGPYATL
ncbi:hypothetical protein Anas_14609 [Armadillidium nasatum]|uniref:Uncharacterized protein n=1 Tax=Armadillidium nasatum TaxID=96803 RepID=A0A5N5SZX5_9CRUS|nr:hypothetical protein Anas_14609 [Armadillidium nasatum]